MITKEMFAEWKAHPVTVEIFQEVQKAKERLMTNLCDGLTIGQRADVTHGMTNKMVGQIEGLNQLLNITYESEEEDDLELKDIVNAKDII